jgi:hypothetical protein
MRTMDEPSGRLREFRLPTALEPFVEKLCATLLDAARAGGIDDDGINFGGVPDHWRPAYIVHLATATFSEIVEHLDIVLLDLRALGDNVATFQGTPDHRYRLLLRTFFHEYFRFRECLRMIIKALQRAGIVSPEAAREMREKFDAFFRPMVQVRNELVHDAPTVEF